MIYAPGTPIALHPITLPGGGSPVRPEDITLLTENERTRANKFRHDRDRDNFTACRASLHRLLGDAEITTSPAGKPSAPGFTFNVSHTKTHAIIAITTDPSITQLGIDLERIDPSFSHLEIARRHFPKEETAQLESLNPSLIPEVFTRLWTAREAALKALGTGLQWDLDRVIINLQNATATAQEHSFNLHFLEIPEFPDDHLVTLAVT